jgi:hypothetical protein
MHRLLTCCSLECRKTAVPVRHIIPSLESTTVDCVSSQSSNVSISMHGLAGSACMHTYSTVVVNMLAFLEITSCCVLRAAVQGQAALRQQRRPPTAEQDPLHRSLGVQLSAPSTLSTRYVDSDGMWLGVHSDVCGDSISGWACTAYT